MTASHSGPPIAVLVAEDDADVRETTRLLLERRGFSVRTASDGVLALEEAVRDAPDLAVVDVAMPRMDGLALTRELLLMDVPVILLTARDLSSDVVGGLDSGADDYIIKPFDADILAARIRSVLRRRQIPSPALETFGDLRIDRAAMSVERDGRPVGLTNTEFRLLCVLLDHRGVALSRTQIVEHVWGSDGWDYHRVVDTNIQRLRRKIDSDLIHTVRGVGYRVDVA